MENKFWLVDTFKKGINNVRLTCNVILTWNVRIYKKFEVFFEPMPGAGLASNEITRFIKSASVHRYEVVPTCTAEVRFTNAKTMLS